MITRKTIALTKWTFVGKVMSLLFSMLSRLARAFLPKSKRLLISWLQSPSAVIWEPKKIVSHCFHCFPIYFPFMSSIHSPKLNLWYLLKNHSIIVNTQSCTCMVWYQYEGILILECKLHVGYKLWLPENFPETRAECQSGVYNARSSAGM